MTTENTFATTTDTSTSAARPAPADEHESPAEQAAAPPTAPSDEAPAQNAGQEQPTAEDAAPAEAPTADAAEKVRRRVQLKPTYSPHIAKPVPSIATPSPPLPASPQPTTAAAPAEEASPPDKADATPTAAVSVTDTTPEPPEQDQETAVAQQAAPAPKSPPPPPAEPVELPPREEPLDADIEAQLDAALSGDEEETPSVAEGDMAAAAEVAAAITEEDVAPGARLSGTVQSIHGDDMFIEFGLRMAGVLSRRQFGLKKQPMQGESITVIVNRIDDKEGLILVNLPSGATKVRGNWDEVTVDQTVECLVNQTNKGGLEVSVGSLRGFMPASQVELGYVADLSTYVGQRLNAQVTEVNPKRRKLVLSRRKLLEQGREQTEKDLFEKIAPGQTYEGRVKTIKDYGAFVDIGGVDGLLHVGQISWSRINHPKEVLTEGQQIEVKVLSIDQEKKKISLGMRQLSQNPWKTVEEKYASGRVLKGKVTRLEAFGGFIELEPGIEGLVHISEMDHKRIKTVHEVLRVGQEVDVQVLEVDPSRKRISLSVKALKEKPEEAPPPDEEAAPVRRQAPESLKGGIGEPTRGKLFGDPRQFGR